MYPKFSNYTKLDGTNNFISPFSHFNLLNLIQNIEDSINNSEFDEITNDEGADGKVAAEIYRMLAILNDKLIKLRNTEKNIRKHRTKEKQMYALEIEQNHLVKHANDNNVLMKFIKENRRCLMKNESNMWITAKLDRRNQWYDELKQTLEKNLSYKNYIECPICCTLSESKFTRIAIDGYHYCEKCCNEVEISGGFNKRQEF
ncbi:hypothetical protein [Clostridium sp.]|uniref:hypothetical protein n=1 Tax=Clostridium sp. TaxID=1506 RepID=UPI003D6C9F60